MPHCSRRCSTYRCRRNASRLCRPKNYDAGNALIQDAAYENLLKSRRQVLHRRVGEVLRDQFSAIATAEPELLAHHFTQAGLAEIAVDCRPT
jgi:predicted ATPase